MNATMKVSGTALPTSPAMPMPLRDIAMTGPMKPTEIAVTSHVLSPPLATCPKDFGSEPMK